MLCKTDYLPPIDLFTKYLLRDSCMQGAVVGSKNMEINKAESLPLKNLSSIRKEANL